MPEKGHYYCPHKDSLHSILGGLAVRLWPSPEEWRLNGRLRRITIRGDEETSARSESMGFSRRLSHLRPLVMIAAKLGLPARGGEKGKARGQVGQK